MTFRTRERGAPIEVEVIGVSIYCPYPSFRICALQSPADREEI